MKMVMYISISKIERTSIVTCDFVGMYVFDLDGYV